MHDYIISPRAFCPHLHKPIQKQQIVNKCMCSVCSILFVNVIGIVQFPSFPITFGLCHCKTRNKNEHTNTFICVILFCCCCFCSRYVHVHFICGKMHGKSPFIKIQWKYSENRCLHPFKLIALNNIY